MDEHFPQIIRQWLGNERSASVEGVDKPTKEAADICGRSQATSEQAKGKEPVNRKERTRYNSSVKPIEELALKKLSKEKGFLVVTGSPCTAM